VLVHLHLVEAQCDKQTKSEPGSGSDRPETQPEITAEYFENWFGRFECLAGRYRYPVLILSLIVEEHARLNQCQ
jgi:hypothetical protein